MEIAIQRRWSTIRSLIFHAKETPERHRYDKPRNDRQSHTLTAILQRHFPFGFQTTCSSTPARNDNSNTTAIWTSHLMRYCYRWSWKDIPWTTGKRDPKKIVGHIIIPAKHFSNTAGLLELSSHFGKTPGGPNKHSGKPWRSRLWASLLVGCVFPSGG